MNSARESMTPEQAERYLSSLELFGMRFGLDRMHRLMTILGAPQRQFDSIHVVGTNGKSSTTRMIAAILKAHGRRSGAYLSPHVRSLAERIEVDGAPVTVERFASAVAEAAHATRMLERTMTTGDRVTQFEALTAAAYRELARADVDVAAIEAGLGGRYDATSVIESKVQVLTNVGLEHTRWLGPTEADIAAEKLAVVPQGGCLIAGALSSETLALARTVTDERDAQLLLAGRDFDLDPTIELSVLGDFQRGNFALATAAVEAYLGGVDVDAVRDAAAHLSLPGRLEAVSSKPLVLLDGAHNPSGVRALAGSLAAVTEGKRMIVMMSVLDDKDAASMLAELMPHCAGIVFTRSDHARALSPATLESLWRQLGGPAAQVEADPRSALERASETAGEDGAVLVTGSIYLLSDLARGHGEPRAMEG